MIIGFLARPVCLVLLALMATGPARAEVTSQDQVLSADLLTGWKMDSGAHMTALKLDLAPGWKTYWRSPGDAGIPPQFDWSGSQNLRAVRLHWPSPSVFRTNGMQTIGYHDQLVLPVEIVAVDPSKPVILSAQVELGVCHEICMPASLAFKVALPSPGAPDATIRTALDARPRTAKEARVTSIGCEVEPIPDGLRLTATLDLPARGGRETVAFETADPSVWVSEAASERHGGKLVAVTELVPPSGAPFALNRSGVTVTVIDDRGAIEIAGCPAP